MLTGTRGGKNRVRVLQAVDDQSMNPNQLPEALDLDYTTIRHHLDLLEDHGVVRQGGEG